MMKKVCAVMVLVGMFFSVGYAESHYTRKDCEVTNVTETGMIVTDKCGFTWYWEFDKNEKFELGERVNMKMYTSGTSGCIDDDEILKIERVD